MGRRRWFPIESEFLVLDHFARFPDDSASELGATCGLRTNAVYSAVKALISAGCLLQVATIKGPRGGRPTASYRLTQLGVKVLQGARIIDTAIHTHAKD
jgi:predicted ArsR family transcriptional regulator